jgi:tetratricopeptide (TPR) repeat protein
MRRYLIAALLALLPATAAMAEDSGSGMRYQRCLDDALDPQVRIPNCEQLIKDHGTYLGYAYLGLGNAYAAAGDYQKALDAYATLENFRYWTAPKVKRSELYAAMGDYDKALADANAVIDMRGGRAIGLHSRCWARAITGKELEAGLADCDEALKTLTGAVQTLQARGIILMRLGRWADAVAAFDAALKGDARRVSALYMRGYCEKQAGDARTGDADMAAALAGNRDAIDFYVRTGVLPKPG